MAKFSVAIIFLLCMGLSACSIGNVSNPPATISSNNPAPGERQSQDNELLSTSTPIPLPSPTSTLTPMPSPTQALNVTSVPPFSIATPHAEVIVSAINVRQGPGLDYPIIGIARMGDIFEVFGVNSLGDWLQVGTHDGKPGWISGQILYSRLSGAEFDDLPIVQAPPLPASGTAVSQRDHAIPGNSELSGKLIFITSSGGDLYSINADGRDLRRLAGGVIDPVISPDEQQVAFTRWDGAEFGTPYIINVDGTGERAIIGDIRQPKSPTWSPDGRQIVISFQHGGLRDPGETCRNFKPGQEIDIPTSNVTITSFHGSRNGEIDICYLPFEDLPWRLRLIDVATGEFEDLPSDEYSYNPAWDLHNPWRVIYASPAWSPDGSHLAFVTDRTGFWEIWVMESDGSNPRPLFPPEIQAQFALEYHGVNERMLNWIE